MQYYDIVLFYHFEVEWCPLWVGTIEYKDEDGFGIKYP